MYLKGNRWNMTKRPKKRSSPWRILLLLGLIGIFLYLNQVVVPATPPLFIPTATPTRSPESFLNEAEGNYAQGKLPQAIASYKQAIIADPNNPAIYVALARAQAFSGDYKDAIVNTQNALLKNPNNPMAHAVQAWAHSQLEDHLAAEAAIKKAVELDPNNALAHAYYAEILVNKGDYGDIDKAIEESKAAMSLDPNLLETHRSRGLVLLSTQNVEEAIQEFKTAIAINDKIADLHLSLGFAYRLNGENDLAVEELLTAFALNPDSPTAPAEISLAYANEGQFGKAVQYAEQTVKVEPRNTRLWGNLGVMYYRNQELEKAIPALGLVVHGGTTEEGVAVEGLPLDYTTIPQYYWFYGFALAKSNRCAEAVPVFQALLSGVPDYELAVENAQAGIALCQESLDEPIEELEPTEEPEPTPTP
jgi:tetratricopeptide (TPR) repeat protein